MLLGQSRGKFYVRYPDGLRGCRMTLPVAKDYAQLFNGKICRESDHWIERLKSLFSKRPVLVHAVKPWIDCD